MQCRIQGGRKTLLSSRQGQLDDISTLEGTPSVELNVKHRLSWVSAVKGAKQRESYN